MTVQANDAKPMEWPFAAEGSLRASPPRLCGRQPLRATRPGGVSKSNAVQGGGDAPGYRTWRRFVERGLEAASSEVPRVGARRKPTGREEALSVAMAGSGPPTGRAYWTLELLDGEMVVRTEHEDFSHETVRLRLSRRSGRVEG